MARITVEDCLRNVDNRFDLVLKASKRAHMLELGEADAGVEIDNDKPTVIALREIAAGHDITKTRKDIDALEFDAEVEVEGEVTQITADADSLSGVITLDNIQLAEALEIKPEEPSSEEE